MNYLGEIIYCYFPVFAVLASLREYSGSGWVDLCAMKEAVILINEFDQGMDRLHLWIHGDFRKVKIFRLEKLIPACGSIGDPIQRRC